MAVGTVSGINLDEQWQLISSVAASGTSITFSSLTGYKHIWVTGRNITKDAAQSIGIRPNNDTSVGSYAASAMGNDSKFYCGTTTAGSHALSFRIYNIDQSAPHRVELVNGDDYDSNADAYVNPVPITSITLVAWNTTSSFTGGTIAVYGIPA